MNNEVKRFESDSSLRLDEFLTTKLSISRSQIKKMITNGLVSINGLVITKAGTMIKVNDVIEVEYNYKSNDDLKESSLKDQPYEVLYEDEDILVINKHRGVVVHPSAGHHDDTLVNYLFQKYDDIKKMGTIDPERPGIVHRIDKDTSGALIIAKNIKALAALQEMVKNHEVKREYMCLVKGHPHYNKFMVDANIGKSGSDRKNMAIVPYDQGKSAITHFQVIKKYKNSSLIRCRLETGRTHQIRVHLSSFNLPIIGDQSYGKNTELTLFDKGQLLHAYKISFVHPLKNIKLSIYAPTDSYFKKSLKILASN